MLLCNPVYGLYSLHFLGPGRIAKVGTGFPHPFETPLHIGFVLSDGRLNKYRLVI